METETIKKPSKIGAIFYGLLVMAVYLIIVSIPQLLVLAPIIVQANVESAGDVQKYTEIYMQLLGESADKITISTAVGTVLAVIVTVIWFYFGVYKKKKAAGTIEKVGPKLKNAKSIIFLVSAAIAGNAVATLIMDLLLTLMPTVASNYVNSMNTVIGGVQLLGTILAVVLAPIGEELCLRGIVMNRTQKSFGLVGCIVLSGIFFGIYHLNPIQGIYAIPMGMVFGYISYKYKSVIPSIIAHFINNIAALFLGILYTTWYSTLIVIVVFGAIAVIFAGKLDFLKKDNAITE